MKHKTFGLTFSSIADFAAGCEPAEPMAEPVEQGKTETPEARQEALDTDRLQQCLWSPA